MPGWWRMACCVRCALGSRGRSVGNVTVCGVGQVQNDQCLPLLSRLLQQGIYIYMYLRYVNLHLASLITFKVGDAPSTAMSALHIAPNGGNVISVFYGFEHCGIDTSSWLQCT